MGFIAGNNDHPTIPVTQLQQPKAEENKEKTENKEKSEGDNKEKGDSKEKDDKGDDDHIFS